MCFKFQVFVGFLYKKIYIIEIGGGIGLGRIAIVSTRLGGIDGVSIEADKWAKAYESLGLEPIYIAGNFGKQTKRSYKIEEMDYYHPEIRKIRSLAFNKGDSDAKKINISELREDIDSIKNIIKKKLTDIIDKNEINYFSIENALSIPLNIPLGIALSEIILEKKIATITRHHDFYWEREEFLNSSIQDLLDRYFPPEIDNIKHVVINTIAQKSLYSKRKIRAEYIPNVFDFEISDRYNAGSTNLKKILNIASEDYLFLQPTRIIKRKRIERSIQLVEKLSREMRKKIYLFVTGKSEKDEIDYFHKIKELADCKNVKMILNEDIKSKYVCGLKKDMLKMYNISIYDAYYFSDLVTLPSDVEGFGNPVIEACAFKKPLFVNNYPVLGDILSKGFEFVVIDGKVDYSCVEKIKKILTDDSYRAEVVEKNYNIARKFYSIEFLTEKLKDMLASN